MDGWLASANQARSNLGHPATSAGCPTFFPDSL